LRNSQSFIFGNGIKHLKNKERRRRRGKKKQIEKKKKKENPPTLRWQLNWPSFCPQIV
jgi:hypothetical protein